MSISTNMFADLSISLNRLPVLVDARFDYSTNNNSSSIQLNSDWQLLDLYRRDKLIYTQTHLINSSPNELCLDWIGGLPNLAKGSTLGETGCRLAWDISKSNQRLICFEFESVNGMNCRSGTISKLVANSSPLNGKFVQWWRGPHLIKTIDLFSKTDHPIKHGKIYSNKEWVFGGVCWSTDHSKVVYLAEHLNTKAGRVSNGVKQFFIWKVRFISDLVFL